jgi:predicted Fe-Mo cluster-binding NifX family protein
VTEKYIAVSSQNFRTITGHAGKARRFLVYAVDEKSNVTEKARLDLPMEMAMHDFNDPGNHPLDDMSILITGGAGMGFVQRMAQRGVRVLTTAETDPKTAVLALLAGCLKAPVEPCDCNHDHAGH